MKYKKSMSALTIWNTAELIALATKKLFPLLYNCIELGTVCDACRGKGHIVIEPALRPCDFYLEKKIKCIKAVVCVTEKTT